MVFSDFFTNPFLLNALLAALAASLASGIVGSYVVVKRISLITGSIAHAVLSGLGCATWLHKVHGITWISPLHGALLSAVISALFLGWVHRHYQEREDALIATLWAIGMAVGMIFLAQTPGYNIEVMSYFLGNILWVTSSDLYLLLILDIILLAVVALLYKRFLAICFDETQATMQGLPVTSLYMLLLLLIAVTIVLLVQCVGIVLVMTMLTLPPTIASLATRRLSTMMIGAVLLNALFSLSGTFIAYPLNWPPSATTSLLAGLSYALLLFFLPKRTA